MNKVLLPLFVVIISCNPTKEVLTYETPQLKIKSLSKNVFMHISYLTTSDFGKVECNGMVYVNGDEAIVFDTPTDDPASAELIRWVEETQGKKIKAVVATHFHNDCLGGLNQFHKSGIKSYASLKTIELVKKANSEVLPELSFDTQIEFNVGEESVYATYYGAGHTEDNIVGYIPSEKTLFGGCLIKSMNASKGFLGDANIQQWPKTVEVLKRNLPNLTIVIPGHGQHGGVELLEYTIQLFR